MRANTEDRGAKGDCTALMESASSGHLDIVKLLINHGADINAQSSSGKIKKTYCQLIFSRYDPERKKRKKFARNVKSADLREKQSGKLKCMPEFFNSNQQIVLKHYSGIVFTSPSLFFCYDQSRIKWGLTFFGKKEV